MLHLCISHGRWHHQHCYYAYYRKQTVYGNGSSSKKKKRYSNQKNLRKIKDSWPNSSFSFSLCMLFALILFPLPWRFAFCWVYFVFFSCTCLRISSAVLLFFFFCFLPLVLSFFLFLNSWLSLVHMWSISDADKFSLSLFTHLLHSPTHLSFDLLAILNAEPQIKTAKRGRR